MTKKGDKERRYDDEGKASRLLNFDFITCLTFLKNIIYQTRIATKKKLEKEVISIINAMEMLEATKGLFERISGNEMNGLIDSAAAFSRRMEVDPEADFIRHHCR